MKFQLFVSRAFAPCRDAERIWGEAARQTRIAFSVVDVNSPNGSNLAERMRVTVVPAVAVDGRLLAIGVQTTEEARRLIASAGGGDA